MSMLTHHPLPVRRSRRARRFHTDRVEQLDDRLLLSTFSVMNLNDSGGGSLRAALVAADAAPGGDTIDFHVAGAITLTSGALPPVSDTVNIDGTTAPGFRARPVVEIDFDGFGGLRFDPGSAGSALKSLGLVRAGSDALTLKDTGNLVTGNNIGFRLGGPTAREKFRNGTLGKATSPRK